MFSEFDQHTKNYAYKASEVLAKGILLPPNALKEYENREILWNAVEKSEKQWNAQLARDFIIALPRELPKEQYELLVHEYCQQQFVSQGMIADYAIHDKSDGNPHAHIMLTMRAMDEQGKWLAEKKEEIKKLSEPEKPQPTIYDFISRFVDLRKQGRIDWNRKAKETAGVNDLKFLSSVLLWMTKHNVQTLDDFLHFIEEKKAAFSELNAANKEIRRLQTTLKHIDAFEKNQPIYAQSKRGFDFVKKKYAEAYKDEISAYVKAVKYMKANGIQAGDEEKLTNDLKNLETQRTKMFDVLAEQDIDPDLIGRIQYCIKTVMEAGEIPEHQKSILEQLQQPLKRQTQAKEEHDYQKQNQTIY